MRFPHHLQSAGEMFSRVIHPVLEKLGNCSWFNIQYLCWQSVTLVFMFCTLNARHLAVNTTVNVCKHHEISAFPTTPSARGELWEQAMGRLRRKTRSGNPARCEQQAVNEQVQAHLPLLFPHSRWEEIRDWEVQNWRRWQKAEMAGEHSVFSRLKAHHQTSLVF